MQKTPVNPWPWSVKFGFNQAEIIEGAKRQLICAGQTAVDADGNPQHSNDMREQLKLTLSNLSVLLADANMTLANVTHLRIFTTDVEEAMKNFDLLGKGFGAVNAAPPMTVLEVSGLALPPLMIEIEATAAD